MNTEVSKAVQRVLLQLENLPLNEWATLFASISKEENRYLFIFNFIGDVTADPVFQVKFNGFYQMRRNAQWRAEFYRLFQEFRLQRQFEPQFSKILESLHTSTNRWEYSFSTKMLHSLDSSQPIIDAKVMARLGTSIKGVRDGSTLNKHYETHQLIMRELLSTSEIKKIIGEFNVALPNLSHISDMKKLDFILWKLPMLKE